MSKQMAREKRPQHVDTEDHVTERIMEAASWADAHRRLVIAAGVALVAVVAAAFYYQDYRLKLVESASVRLQEIQITAQSADVETVRAELQLFIDQFSGTAYSHQARVALGDLELRRDSLAAAIRALEPVADLGPSNPLAFTAMKMIAAAYEQGGDTERALQWYGKISDGAQFDYQRHLAMAEQARLYTAAGRYSDAESLYEQLVAEVDDDPAGQEVYGVRLGEVRALAQYGAVPSMALPTTPAAGGAPADADIESSEGEPGAVAEPESAPPDGGEGE